MIFSFGLHWKIYVSVKMARSSVLLLLELDIHYIKNVKVSNTRSAGYPVCSWTGTSPGGVCTKKPNKTLTHRGVGGERCKELTTRYSAYSREKYVGFIYCVVPEMQRYFRKVSEESMKILMLEY